VNILALAILTINLLISTEALSDIYKLIDRDNCADCPDYTDTPKNGHYERIIETAPSIPNTQRFTGLIRTMREKYPQYSDMPDKQLVDALHAKYYSDIPIEKYYAMVGLTVTKQPENSSAKTAYINQEKNMVFQPKFSLIDFKAANPEFSKVPDGELATYIHGKYYGNMPRSEFDKAIGYEDRNVVSGFNKGTYQQQPLEHFQFNPSKALIDTYLGIVFGFIIFFILTYGLYGKKKDSLAKLGRWWGGIAVLFFLCTGGEKSDEHWSWGWFIGTFIRSLMSFSMGYLFGIGKWYLFTREKQKTNEPPPFSESYNRSSYQNTAQEKSEERIKKEQSYDLH